MSPKLTETLNTEPNNIITNLSNLKLRKVEKDALNKGLTFVPTPNVSTIKKHLLIATNNFFNKLSQKYYFREHPKEQKPLFRKSYWIPPIANNSKLKMYFRKTLADIKRFIRVLSKKPLTKNLTHQEAKALQRLRKNKSIVIKKADKGGSIVILNREDYKQKVFQHLSDESSYEAMPNNPLKDIQTNLTAFLETILYHYHISEDTFKYLLPPNDPRINLFYILPKIHKVEIPGRPIVSSVNSLTENLSQFLTKCIQPLTLKLNSYIKDTKDFLKRIMKNRHFANKTEYLVTIDVKSLYTNIPTPQGISSCIYYIKKHRDSLPEFTPNCRILETLFKFVLENNYFNFEDRLYHQLFGTAMGTKMAPPYATLFLGKLEEEKILVKPFNEFILEYVRFLDDIFILWTGNLEQLLDFQTHINAIHPTIKFTVEYSTEEINFLDTTIYISKKEFKSKLYIKPTDTKSLLHYTSYHPNHTKSNIIYTQALRYRLLTTDDTVLKNELNELATTLLRRGYPLNLINENFKKLNGLTQDDCLFNRTINNKKRPLPNKDKEILPFIVEYYEHLPPLKQLLTRHWHLIKKDKELNSIFPTEPCIVYKKHKNIKNLLVRTQFS